MSSTENLEPKVKVIISAHREIGDIVIKIDDSEYYVEGQKDRKYAVKIDGPNWTCDCPSFVFKCGVNEIDGSCKHIKAIKWMIRNKEKIRDVHEIILEQQAEMEKNG